MPNVHPSIVTSDTAVSSNPAHVYWVAVTAGSTGGLFQLNDSDDDSGTDRLNLNIPANSSLFLDFCVAPIDFLERTCK
jgi:hypothetical protein